MNAQTTTTLTIKNTVLNLLLAFILLGFQPLYAQNKQYTKDDNAQKRGFCYFDEMREAEIESNNYLKTRYEHIDALLQHEKTEHQRGAKSASSANHTIPVVFYIVHEGGVENITDQQVTSQLGVMNAEFASHGIEFCLARNDGATPLPGSTTPGIIRIQNSLLTNHLQSDEQQLKALSLLDGNRFLRVWVVKDINNGSGVAGYARFPGGSAALDGIVIRYDVVGEASTCACSLIPNYDKGLVMIHEVGHWLGLYHTFQGGCAGGSSSNCTTDGDQICDTPPVASPNYGCPSLGTLNSCSGTPADLTNNFMDYTNDHCRNAFTPDQETRMLGAISNFRQTLVSASNLLYTGVSCATSNCCLSNTLFAEFTASNLNPCLGETITFSATQIPGATYSWDFGDQTPGTGPSVTHNYSVSTPQTKDVTLTVTSNGQSVSVIQKLFLTDCTIYNCRQGNWYFGTNAGLDFSSGSPQALNNGNMGTLEGCVTQSLANCSLAYYSNGWGVWDKMHNMINIGQSLTGNFSTAQSALSIPDPAGSDDYFLFTAPPFCCVGSTLDWAYTRVNVTLNSNGTSVNNLTLSNINTIISLPAGMTKVSEAQVAIEKCNNEYWILVKDYHSGAMLVYEFTTSGISHIATYPASGNAQTGVRMQFSRDGTKLAVSGAHKNWFSIFDFNRDSGVLSNERYFATPTESIYGISFSPNSRYLYVSQGTPLGRLMQYDVLSSDILASGIHIGDPVHAWNDIQIGPDDKLYVSVDAQDYISVINYPNERATPSNPNACGYNPNGPSLEDPSNPGNSGTCRFSLPSTINARPASLVPLEITYSMVNCSTVVFRAPDCNGPYAWDFGDPASGGNNPTTAEATHTFSQNGTYMVTLYAGSNTRSLKMSIGLNATVLGSDVICPSISALGNYSCTNIPGAQYVWSVSSGGSLQSLNGTTSMDILWTTLPGTVSVQITDPHTGCTTTEIFNVTQSCSQADLFMKDSPADFGVEPNPDNAAMWVSEDIWVRNSQDPPPFANQHIHQNPEYSATVPNYIYVKVRNKGQLPSSGTEELKLYWAKASTALSWPNPWLGGFYFGSSQTMPQGDVVGSQTIPVVQPGDFAILEFPWYPEDPDDYASVFGLDKAHFCILARIETSNQAPYGMTTPETANLFQNVKANNNIVWKNITVVDLVSNFTGSGTVSIGNPTKESRAFSLQFGMNEKEERSFLDQGSIRVHLDKELMSIVREANAKLEGMEWVDEKTLLVTSLGARLDNIKLKPQEHHVVQFEFEWNKENKARKGETYQFDLIQYEQGRKDERLLIGGETFVIQKKEKTKKKRFWLWNWLFRLFGK